jgi:hypothetical protein
VSHVAPHRWAELARGTIAERDERRMREHADRCDACAQARDRVTGATRAFADIAATPAPELGWDTIRTRVYWATSSERRERERTQRMHAVRLRRWGWVAVPAVAAAAAASVMLARSGGSSHSDDAPVAPSIAHGTGPASAGTGGSAHAPAAPTTPEPLHGVVTLAQGDVTLDGTSHAAKVLAHEVDAGATFATGDGRVAVQFGDGSVFAVGPRSNLRVRRFDAAAIDLALGDAGEVTIEVAPRAPGQRFTVTAGDRTVEVRGTAFHVVRRGGTLDVACAHGLVAVRDHSGELLVPAGQGVVIGDADALADRAAHALDDAAIDALGKAIGPRLPVWTDHDTMLRTSAPLAIAATHGRAIRVDGVRVGDGAMVVRVMSGRHLVEAADRGGAFGAGAGQWIEAGPGRADGRIDARVEVAALAPVAEPPAGAASARAARKAELDRALDHARVDACVRPLAKQGIAGAHVSLAISVDADGAINMLNVGDTDLPGDMAACVRDAVATVHFAHGAAATFTTRLTF